MFALDFSILSYSDKERSFNSIFVVVPITLYVIVVLYSYVASISWLECCLMPTRLLRYVLTHYKIR